MRAGSDKLAVIAGGGSVIPKRPPMAETEARARIRADPEDGDARDYLIANGRVMQGVIKSWASSGGEPPSSAVPSSPFSVLLTTLPVPGGHDWR